LRARAAMRVSAVMRLVLLDALRGARAFGGRGGRLARAPVAKRSARLSAVAAPGFDSWFKALPQGSTAALAKSGYAVAAPIQVCAWQETADGRGAARGESVAIHAPTGCGKTLAMVLPTLASTLWSGRGGKLLILVPTREIAQQHEQLVRCLLAEGDEVVSVTTSTIGADVDEVAERLPAARVVVATPNELARLMEHRPTLYGDEFAGKCEALVLDELDLLMPARKFDGSRFSRWQERGMHPAEALVKVVAKRASTLQVIAGSATLDSGSKKKLEKHLADSPVLKKALPLRTVRLDAGDEETLLRKEKSDVGKPNLRSTIVPKRIAHFCQTLKKDCHPENVTAQLLATITALKPRTAIVFSCSALPIKVRAIVDALKPVGAVELGDVLWPDAARARRRGRKNHRLPEASEEQRDSRTRDGADKLVQSGAGRFRDKQRSENPGLRKHGPAELRRNGP